MSQAYTFIDSVIRTPWLIPTHLEPLNPMRLQCSRCFMFSPGPNLSCVRALPPFRTCITSIRPQPYYHPLYVLLGPGLGWESSSSRLTTGRPLTGALPPHWSSSLGVVGVTAWTVLSPVPHSRVSVIVYHSLELESRGVCCRMDRLKKVTCSGAHLRFLAVEWASESPLVPTRSMTFALLHLSVQGRCVALRGTSLYIVFGAPPYCVVFRQWTQLSFHSSLYVLVLHISTLR